MKNLLYIGLFCLSLSVCGQKKTKTWTYKNQKYILDTLSINTDKSDFGINYIGNDQVVFSSPTKNELFKKKWKGNNQGYLELYKGDVTKEGSVVNVEKYSKVLNSKYHEAALTITKDGKYVYFTSNNHVGKKGIKDAAGYNNLQLYKADIVDGGFQNVRSLPFNAIEYSTGHPYLSEDDKTLYFVSDRPGGYGATDIYKVAILEDDTYGEVINLGRRVNSQAKEMFPFLDVDGVLYFSSDRTGTKGGLDVFGISLTDTRDVIFQLPAPINSIKDDFAFVLSKNNHGFLSSNRDEGKGDDDIYKLLTNCIQSLEGTVLNQKTKLPLDKSKIYISQSNKIIDSVFTNSKGRFHSNITINCGESYSIEATKLNYRSDSISITTPNSRNYNNIINLNLTPEFVENKQGAVIVNIDPIYFDFNKSTIRPDAALILDKVVTIMNKYPKMIVKGTSHTDSRGNDRYNEKLSARRAKATVAYIISKGISASRISSQGYGEKQLVNRCSNNVKCTEEEHDLNRRTEFVIIKK